MYYSKQNGGNTFAFYSPEMNAAAVERLMLKSKLRRALERDELEIKYQPKVDLRNGRIIGAEALLRWRLPGHGDIPPSQFIPLAEETNLILDIGEWVLNRVCLDYRHMQSEGGDPGRISLNLSLKQLRQASFILRCRSVFRRHRVSPTAFELEITETTLMADPQRTVRLLDELYAMGLHLSIDDFGTGYSSLSALQQFPIGTLKIDQSFVRDATRGCQRRHHRAHHHRDGTQPRHRGHRRGRRVAGASWSSCAATAATMDRAASSASRARRKICSRCSRTRRRGRHPSATCCAPATRPPLRARPEGGCLLLPTPAFAAARRCCSMRPPSPSFAARRSASSAATAAASRRCSR